jgi:hypothetical protein
LASFAIFHENGDMVGANLTEAIDSPHWYSPGLRPRINRAVQTINDNSALIDSICADLNSINADESDLSKKDLNEKKYHYRVIDAGQYATDIRGARSLKIDISKEGTTTSEQMISFLTKLLEGIKILE